MSLKSKFSDYEFFLIAFLRFLPYKAKSEIGLKSSNKAFKSITTKLFPFP